MNQSELEKINATFEKDSPQDILAWAIKTHTPNLVLSSSFGGESAGLIHMAIQIEPEISIIFINTGFLFKETLEFADTLKKRFNLNLKEHKANFDDIEQIQKKLKDPKNLAGSCCDEVKVRLMQESLTGARCWIAGLRRHQASTRKNIKIVESTRTGLVKVHPLANWTSKEIYAYMKTHDLPFHPLWHKGYKSIGCEPCTTLPLPGPDDRSGRWAGTEKTECGIHTFMADDKEI